VQIVVQAGSLAARNYHIWQELFGKIHSPLSQIFSFYISQMYLYEILVKITAQ